MYRESEKELDKRDAIIIEIIDRYLVGISFNNLATAVTEYMSKVTLSNRIKKLLEIGMIVETKDAHHKQKKIYKSTTKMKEFINILSQIDAWAQSQIDRLSKLELIADQNFENNENKIVEGLAEILGEVGIPMVYVIQIRLRYNLRSAMLVVPRAIEAANTILERMIVFIDSHPNISERLTRYLDADTYATIIERITERYLPSYNGIIAYSNTPTEKKPR